MTKFSQLHADQKDAMTQFLAIGLGRLINDQMEHTNQAHKLLVLGNGAGIALLASFMGVILSNKQPIDDLVAPLGVFLLGTIFAAIIHAQLSVFMHGSVTFHFTQAQDFLLDRVDLEGFKNWVPNRTNKFIGAALPLASFLCFIIATGRCVYILAKLQPS